MNNGHKELSMMSHEELWQLFPIILSEHSSDWVGRYKEERDKLIKIIGIENVCRINHIGSTAVKGLIAKPTIDILVEITDQTDTDDFIRNMEEAGYIYSAQPQKPPPHMMFMKGYTPQGFEGQVYHIHIRYAGDWDELYFRDYLQEHPEIAAEYGCLKQHLMEKYKHNRDAYTDKKGEFIRKVTSFARTLYRDRYLFF